MHIFLFDIDGTLLLTGGAGLNAVNRTFAKVCGPNASVKIIKADGKTDPVILEELFVQVLNRPPSDSERATLGAVYEEMMAEELPLAPHFRLMPGAFEFVAGLSIRPDVVLGLATGNYEKTAWQKLKRAGLDGYFKFGGFGSDSKIRRELTEMALKRALAYIRPRSAAQIYVVGDTVHDIDCGKFIGAKTIAVATGNTSEAELLAHRPDFFFPSLLEAQGALARLLSLP
ncbi:MAG: HAD family hydrolase [Deltaproteobacteria bacterium]|nr:HAD family hydrolase [Deltaproteobacteria bacterium]